MRHHLHLLLAPLLFAACGSSKAGPSPTSGQACVQRSGSYRADFVERSGNCGPVSEQVVVLDAQTTGAVSQCSGQSTADALNCSITEDLTCPGNPGYVINTRGVIHWADDASTGGGIVQWTIYQNGVQLCVSSYDITYTRL